MPHGRPCSVTLARRELAGRFPMSANLPQLENIRIVLVHTSHPGNIGGVARAMKNMGLSQLYLVSPKEFPSEKAVWRASNALDTLDGAKVVASLDEAIGDCGLVIGTSARDRAIPWTVCDARRAAEVSIQSAAANQVALVFGREDRGLTNEELQRCHMHLHIPSNEEYSSLNLAAAVQVVCYEVRQAWLAATSGDKVEEEWDIAYASADDVQRLYEHLEQVMIEVGFYDPDVPKQLPARMKRFLARSRLDQMEVNILRGFLAAVQRKSSPEGE